MVLSWAALILLLASQGCSSPLGCSKARPATRRYTVRGQLIRKETYGHEQRLLIEHERIANFYDRSGKSAPMPAMKMLFGLSEPLHAFPVAPGDKILVTFAVRWNERPVLLVTELTKLDADTRLALPDAEVGGPALTDVEDAAPESGARSQDRAHRESLLH